MRTPSRLALGKDDQVEPLVSAVTTVEHANIGHGHFVFVHVNGKNSSTQNTVLAMVTTAVGDYITVMYLRCIGIFFH